jgi:hypothetical protein
MKEPLNFADWKPILEDAFLNMFKIPVTIVDDLTDEGAPVLRVNEFYVIFPTGTGDGHIGSAYGTGPYWDKYHYMSGPGNMIQAAGRVASEICYAELRNKLKSHI